MPKNKLAPLIADEIKVMLTKPIEAHGHTISELTIRAPTGADLESGDPNEPHYMGHMISRLAQIPPASVKDLAGRDYTRAARLIARFLAHPEDEEE